jgi:cytochrome c-type biogenesis protein CcmH
VKKAENPAYVMVLGVVLVLAAAIAGRAATSDTTAEAIGDRVICQCGCNMPVNTCNHEQCSSRDEMRAMAAKEIAAGKSETLIMQDFVLAYGVKVLATPPATGFNLAVWILPGVALIVGLVLVVFLVRRWRKPPAGPEPPSRTPDSAIDPKILAAVEREMERLAD